jgi:uncharacterized membrane protein
MSNGDASHDSSDLEILSDDDESDLLALATPVGAAPHPAWAPAQAMAAHAVRSTTLGQNQLGAGGMGGLMAAPVFASSVVAMPLLLDRQLNTLQAVLTSWKVVLTHPMPMVLWAFLIMGLSMMGILSLFIGLIVIVPVLGHASWHAYRDLVDTCDVPERMPRLESL